MNNSNDKKDKKSQTVTGTISINSKGKGFINFPKEDGARGDRENDIPVQPEDTLNALSGDTIEATTYKGFRGDTYAKITKVLERKKTTFVGELFPSAKIPGAFYLEPDDHRAAIAILIRDVADKNFIVESTKENGKPAEGMKALAQVDVETWVDGREPEGTLLKLIGQKGDNNTEMQAIVFERGFDTTFPEVVLKEAEEVNRTVRTPSDADLAARRDFRKVFTCTIDPFDAKDFDDALSIKWLNADGSEAASLNAAAKIEVGVHIADVSHYVREGTELDAEARKRALSVYLVDRTVPMLPSILSTDLCSLNPHEDRMSFSAVFIMDKQANIQERWFGRTIIHSAKRFTYENAQDVLTAGDAGATTAAPKLGEDGKPLYGSEFTTELMEMNRLAKTLNKRRKEKGAIDFESTEIKFKLDDNGKPIAVYKKERVDTHKLVEEFMLLANKEVAEYIYNKNKEGTKHFAGVYRVHDRPNQEKLHDLGIFVRALGFDFTPTKDTGPKDIQKLLDQVVGNGAEAMIKVATLRSMAKALYSTKNVGHFGLAFEYYTHFTSPIRRYPDLMVHRILAKILSGKPLTNQMAATLERICADSSRREVEAADAERTSIKYKQVEFMQDKVGQEMEATVSGIADWGMYVEEPEAKAEGLIRVADIPGDYYDVDPKNYQIVGKDTGKTFKLGDKVRVKLLSTDLENKMLNFVLVNTK